MNLRSILTSVLLTTCFTGCATFTTAEIGQIRQHGVSPVVVGKLEEGRVLSPGDVIELTRRRVPDSFILRQIDDAGVDYVLNRNDVNRLRDAHVSRPVMSALFAASNDFASRYGSTAHTTVYAGYPYDAYYASPYYGAYPPYYPYGGMSVEFGTGYTWRNHRHWR